MNTAPTTEDGTAYQLHGDAAAPLVALIHGLGLNRHIWSAYRAALSPRYRVLTYDLFGHGGSAPPPATPSLALFAAQLRALLDALDIDACALVGFSLGGMINRRFAMDYPARARALAIFNSPHRRSRAAQRLVEQHAAQSATDGPAATLESAIARWFTLEFQAAHPAYIARVRRWLLANDPTHYAQCRRVLAGGVTELLRPQPPIACPALVMTCEHDSGSTPAMSRAIAAEMANARVVIVAGLQHMGLVEQPARFTAPLLRFLDDAIKPMSMISQ